MKSIAEQLLEKGYTEAPKEYTIKVNDYIVYESGAGAWAKKVHRVTPKYCYTKDNDISESKYPLIYDFGFYFIPSPKWKLGILTVYIKNA